MQRPYVALVKVDSIKDSLGNHRPQVDTFAEKVNDVISGLAYDGASVTNIH